METVEAIEQMSFEEIDQLIADCGERITANMATLAVLQIEFDEIEQDLAESYAILGIEF